jgi:hypothetical protein
MVLRAAGAVSGSGAQTRKETVLPVSSGKFVTSTAGSLYCVVYHSVHAHQRTLARSRTSQKSGVSVAAMPG